VQKPEVFPEALAVEDGLEGPRDVGKRRPGWYDAVMTAFFGSGVLP